MQVILLYRWSFYTGGPSIQMVLLYRWSFYTGGPCIQAVSRTGSLHGDSILGVGCGICS